MKNVSRPDYRQDIDGLRAIAVLAVIAFHAFPLWMPGGFIGVDVFFVISGYLITSLILIRQELNTFSLWEFYASRVRRLFPSLIFVLLTCLLFGWFALLSDEYKALGKHIAASALFISNFIFLAESGYFDYAAATKPLLHLWSLGIEVQFYLLWPFIIWLSLRYKRSLLTLTGATLLTSLIFNLFLVEKDISATFYLPFSRMWELLSGCLLACVVKYKAKEFLALKEKLSSSHVVDHGLASLGLIFLAYSLFFFNQDILFPGAFALLPTFGTILIILAGENSWLSRTVLSSRLLIGIGLISYPLYLWHWSLLSFAVILEGTKPNELIRLALVCAAFVLAGFSYYFFERLFRYGKNLRSKTYFLIVSMIVVGCSGLAVYALNGFQGRISNQEIQAQLNDLNFDLPESTGWYCGNLNYDSPPCHSTGPNPTVVVIGDSHALMIYSALRERFQAKGLDIGLYGGSDGCPPLLNVIIQDQGGDPRNCLVKGSKAIERIIADPSIHEVILTSRGPMYTTAKGFGDVELDQFGSWDLYFKGEKPGSSDNDTVFSIALSQTLDALLAAGKKVTYLHDVPELGFDIRRCSSFRPLSLTSQDTKYCGVSREVFEARTESFKRMVNNLFAQRPEIKVIDLSDALCDKDRCYGSKDGVLFYIDDDHLSLRGATYVVGKLWDKF
jgi:peptidoglycan/LPS O-acetylase OafA/YrhL